ncbi:MAG: NADPH-dependent oxidoreductase, partial [Gammaproteobacteria bacterium]|nr:NADPH-dependent oxidoreductase [Gammaproteobacteria bacterium]
MNKKISDLIEYRFGAPTQVGNQMPAEGPLASILERRTHRQYSEQKVDDELLEILIACGL